MKKLILTAAVVCTAFFSGVAQTFTDGQTNLTLNYKTSCLLNVGNPHNGGYAYSGGNIASSGGVSGNSDGLKIVGGTGTDLTTSPGYIDLYVVRGENCQEMRAATSIGINMSGSGHGKVVIRAKSNQAGAEFRFYLASSDGGWPTSTYNAEIIKLVTLTDEYADYTIDFESESAWAGWAGKSKVNLFGVTTGTAGAEYHIESIKFGADAVTGVSLSKGVNSLLSVYPNPASNLLNVDLSNLNGRATAITLTNAAGNVVVEQSNVNSNVCPLSVEGLTEGIYFLQVISENKVYNQKVVVR
ncbi:MAG: T9SS type A sorting domain-containing protein [Cytophagaceae bacterium]